MFGFLNILCLNFKKILNGKIREKKSKLKNTLKCSKDKVQHLIQ